MVTENNNNSKTAVISAKVSPSLKKDYKAWWQSHNFVSEAEAVRAHVRQVIKPDQNDSQAQPASAD